MLDFAKEHGTVAEHLPQEFELDKSEDKSQGKLDNSDNFGNAIETFDEHTNSQHSMTSRYSKSSQHLYTSRYSTIK